jgi:ferrous iron transport protein A
MKNRRLGELNKGEGGLIIAIHGGYSERGEEITQRLLEMGLLEGSYVEVAHVAPFGGNPMAVRVRGALIALRRNEANQIEVSG